MKFVSYFYSALRIILLNRKEVLIIAKDKESTIPSIIILVVSALVAIAIGLSSFDQNILLSAGMFFWLKTIVRIIFLIASSFIVIHLLARMFGSKINFVNFFRPLALTSILALTDIFTLIPTIGTILGYLITVWIVFIDFNIIKGVYGLSTGKVILILIIDFIIALFL